MLIFTRQDGEDSQFLPFFFLYFFLTKFNTEIKNTVVMGSRHLMDAVIYGYLSPQGCPASGARWSKLHRDFLRMHPLRGCDKRLYKCSGKKIWKKQIILQVALKYHPEKHLIVQKVAQRFQRLLMFLCFPSFPPPPPNSSSLQIPTQEPF